MKIKTKIISYSISLVVILGVLIFGLVRLIRFNHVETILEYSNNELFSLVEEENVLDISIKNTTADQPSTSRWTSIIPENGELPSDYNYVSSYYELKISNPSTNDMNSYAVRITADKTFYYHTGWCAEFEVHQFRDGEEKVQVIESAETRSANPDDYVVDGYVPYDAFDVKLEPGDYIICVPSAEVGMVPIGAGYTIENGPGMIFLTHIDETVNVTVSQEIRKTRVINSNYVDSRPTTMKLEPRNDSWTKIIDIDDSGITEPNYMGQTYDLVFKNQNKYELKDYKMTFTMESDAYLTKAWNGSIIVNQNGKEFFIEDLRTYTPSESDGIDYVLSGTEVLIPLKSGDSFTYIPSVEYQEAPLKSDVQIYAGFILYEKIGTELSGSAKIIGQYHKDMTNEPFLFIGILFLIAWFVVLVFEIVLQFRLNKYRKQKEHDEKLIVESIETFTGFIDAKDPYTNGHSNRVAEVARLIAEHYGYDEENLQRIYYIALLHDCGKIGIPDSILGKPSRLTDEEYAIIKQHPIKSAEILKNFTSIVGVREGVLYHHERYDGRGYPEGISGNDIPLDARIICIADSFDAMNSDRCYRKKLTKDEVVKEFERCKGTQFDPELAEIMLYLILSGKIDLEA